MGDTHENADNKAAYTYTPSNILKYFAYEHLPEHLKVLSSPFADLARLVDERGGDPAEKATALRKLLEAKDASVRAGI